MLKFSDSQKIERFNEAIQSTCEIELILTADKRSAQIQAFVDEFKRYAGQVGVKQVQQAAHEGLPAIKIGSSLFFHGRPENNELAPFLYGLQLHSRRSIPLAAPLRQKLGAVDTPARLDLYVSPHCVFCPKAVEQLIPLALTTEMIALHVIDGDLFPEVIQKEGIMSAPTLIIDGEYRYIGTLDVNEIVAMIVQRDAARLSVSALRGMIEEGRAAQVAGLMLRQGQLFPALLELLCHEKWPVRLGAMVVVEYIAEQNPLLAAGLSDSLWQRWPMVDTNTQGDLLHVIAEVGNKDQLPQLQAVVDGKYPDAVKEAAYEAMERLDHH